MLPNVVDGKSLEEWIAILVTGENNEELLGVSVSIGGTGERKVKEACTKLEQVLQRPILWLACRHHVLEVVLKDVFEVCHGPTSELPIAVFKRLRAQ